MNKIRKRKSEIRSQKVIASFFMSSVFCLLFSVFCFAKDIKFEATVGRNKVALGDSLQLSLTFYGTQDIPAVELSGLDGFNARYLGPSTRVSIVNGQMSSSITHIYSLLATKIGKFTIGAFKFDHKGDTYNSNPVDIEVVEGQLPESAIQQEKASAELKGLDDRIFLTIEPKKNKAYLNEPVPLTIKLYVAGLGVRDIQMPELSHEGFLISEFEKPKQYQEILKGLNYDVIEFNTVVSGTALGSQAMGPAKLKCNLAVRKNSQRENPSGFDDFFGADMFGDFFGRMEVRPLELKSKETSIDILSLPEENKPADFSGAIGNFDMSVSAAPETVKIGDPVTLKIAITGEGNFSTVSMPKLNTEKDFKIYEPQIKQEAGKKSFEQIFIPQSDSVKEIPEVFFYFFDTQSETYRTISKGPFPIKVLKPEKEEVAKIVEAPQAVVSGVKDEELGRDILYIKEYLGDLKRKNDFLCKNNLFFVWQLIPFVVFLLTLIFHRRKNKLATDIKYARKLRALKKAKKSIRRAKECLSKNDAAGFYNTVFQALQDYLGDRFHLASQAITFSVVEEVLRGKQISEEILSKLREVFSDCDMYRYAASELDKNNMLGALKKLEEIIDYFQRSKA